jgi:hypothetical protein
MWYSNLGKAFIPVHILQHWHTCPIALLARRNPQHRSLLTVVSATSAPGRHHLRLSNILGRNSRTCCEPLYATNTSHPKQETFLYDDLLHRVLLPTKKMHNRALLFGITPLMHGHYFDYQNQPLNMSMPVCYLDYHEAWLCCYLMIHIENLLHPLELFYFHLWPIYWLSLVYCD